MTDPSVEREAIALFEAMLDIPEADRDGWLDARTAGRTELRARIESMRAADRAASLRTGGAIDDLAEDAPPPDRLGGYRLLDRIGRGGMGSVYRAERDLGDFAHVAAIKVIKPGLLSESLVERFRRERQTLADLSHPNIARLFGGGETEDGAPFIIMELVDGLPVPAWLEAKTPALAARLALFREACDAVAFAHANLVAHRDITPSNILVTRDGHAKLIDFGIARPLAEPGQADRRSPNSLKSLSLTPGYTAPERLAGDPTSTAADIYSLGRVLDRMIGPAAPELRAIVARATAADPAQRYPTVEALAEDVAAWQAGLPVAAFSARRGYTLRKFVARHRLAVVSASLGMVLLVGALAAAIGGYVRAEAARRAEVARFEQLRSLARFMIFDLNARLQRVVGNAEARLLLVDRAQRYLSALADSPGAPPDLRHEAARGFIALARIQGVPTQPNLGQRDRAVANLDRAIAMLRAPDLPRDRTAPDLVIALTSLAMVKAHFDSDAKAAAARIAEADAALAQVPSAGRGADWFAARGQLRAGQLELAVLAQDGDGIARLAERMDREIGEWPATERSSRAAELDRAIADYNRGVAGNFRDDLVPAVAAFRRSHDRLVRLDAVRPNDPAVLYQLTWTDYVGYGTAIAVDRAASNAFLASARATIDRLVAIEPNDRTLRSFGGNILGAEAQALAADGRYRAAIDTQAKVVALYTQALGPDRRPVTVNRLAIAQLTMGNVARQAGDRARSCAAFDAARGTIDELVAHKALLGFVEHYEAGVRENARLCKSGSNVGKLSVLE